VLNDNGLAALPRQLKEITKCIPLDDDDHLIEELKKTVKDHLSNNCNQICKPVNNYRLDKILITMALREHENTENYGLRRKIAEIRHFFIMQTIKYIYRQKKVYKISPSI